jgi:hypothetical protein
MFSKVFGNDYGVSKRSSVTVVVLPAAIPGISDKPGQIVPPIRFRTVADALDLILQDVQEKQFQHRAVVSLSMGFPPTAVFCPSNARLPVLGDPLYPMYKAMEALINVGVVVTTSSGNFGNTAEFGVSDVLLRSCKANIFIGNC